MSLVINSVLSGGNAISATGALLRVVAPTGSTVTVTKSGTTKTASGISLTSSSGESCYYFSFKATEFSSSAWTVTATYGAESDSETVVINAAGEYGVTLYYWDGELYDAGDEYSSVTGGFESFAPVFATDNPQGCAKNAANLRVNFTTSSEQWKNGAWGTTNLLDLSSFSTLHITATTASSSGSNPSNFMLFGVASAKDTTASSATPHGTIAAGTTTLDITSVRSGYVWFGGSSRGAGSTDIVVTKIWLT